MEKISFTFIIINKEENEEVIFVHLNKVERSNVKHVLVSVDKFLIVVVNFHIFSFWIHFLTHEYIRVEARVANNVWIGSMYEALKYEDEDSSLDMNSFPDPMLKINQGLIINTLLHRMSSSFLIVD